MALYTLHLDLKIVLLSFGLNLRKFHGTILEYFALNEGNQF